MDPTINAPQKLRPQSILLKQQRQRDSEDSTIDTLLTTKIRQKPNSTNVKAAIKLIKANIHTSQPSSSILIWNEDRIIIDFGSLYIKVGFSNNDKPFVIPWYNPRIEGVQYLEEYFAGYVNEYQNMIKYFGDGFIMKDKLFFLFNYIFTLLTASQPQSKRIIILENPYLPIDFKNLLVETLFDKFKLSSISFFNTQLAALLSSGQSQGIVIDVGNLETTVVAIYDSRPMHSKNLTSPLAGKALNLYIKKLIVNYAHIQPHPQYNEIMEMQEDMISLEFIENFKLSYLKVSSQLQQPSIDINNIEECEDYFQSQSQRKHIKMNLNYMDKKYIIIIPGWIAEFATEILFTNNDLDQLTPPQLVLEMLLKVSCDLRRPLINNVLLTGGTTAMPGFHYRFLKEVIKLINEDQRYNSLKFYSNSFKLLKDANNAIFNPFHAAWLGGSISCDLRAIKEDIVYETYKTKGYNLKDWLIK